ncbi:MAG: penicillin-binding transpeptidase domain-containing protein, partial [Methylococcaceae bacterium]
FDHGGHGLISMKRIFELSSNIGTAKIITKFFEGKEKEFIDRIYSFGLNKPLGLGFLGEAEPYIKYPTDPSWWGPSLAWIAHGYEIKIAPIQTLAFYNAVANNGVMVKPKFIEEVREDGIPVRKFPTEVINPSICSKSTLSKAKGMLEGVCLYGTGKSLKNPYYTIAGKTGTAVIANENKGYKTGGSKKYQASFVGYFPADNPKFTCIVVIVGPKGKFYGGSVAGPVFRGIADKVYASYLEPAKDSIPPYNEVPVVKPGLRSDVTLLSQELGFKTQSQNLTTERVAVTNDSMTVFVTGVSDMPGTVPEVIGMGADDAVYILEKAGLRTQINGFGRVYRQSLIPGMPFTKGETISLELGFDELEIFKKDSIHSNDSVQTPFTLPTGEKPVMIKTAGEVKSKPADKPQVKSATVKPADKKTATKQPGKKKKTANKKLLVKKKAQINNTKAQI